MNKIFSEMVLVSNNPNFAQVPADMQTTARYRQQMIHMFGDNNLPAMIYKGEMIGKRKL